MQTDAERNLSAIKKLLLIQRHLKYINRFDYSILELLAKNKNHFDLIRSFLTSDVMPSKESYSFSNIKETDQTILGLKTLTDFVFSQRNSAFLINFLTFSILPSYFKFFWTKQSILHLADFFFLIRKDPTYTDEQFDMLSRVVFLSPYFLSFAELAFQPIFSSICDKFKKNANKEKVTFFDVNLLSNISKFQFLLPQETFVVLKLSNDIFRTLKNSLIKPALSSKKSANLYNFFHPSQEPSEKLLLKLQSKIDPFLNYFISELIENNPFFTDLNNEILSMIQNFENLDDLICKVNDTSIYDFPPTVPTIVNHIPIDSMTYDQIEREPHKFVKPKHFFSPIELFESNDLIYFQEYFNPLFVSSNDLQFFNFFNQKSSSFHPTSETTLYFDFNGTLSNFQRIKLNINNDLKTLLLKSNQIRLYRTPVTSLHSFLNGLSGSYSSQSLNNMPMNSLMAEIDNSFHLLENEPIKHDFAVDYIFPLLNHNNILVDYQTMYFYDLFDYFHLLSKKVKLLSLKKYVKHPNLFLNDFEQIKQANQKINEKVILQRMLKETQFTMSMYLKERENIRQKLDSINQLMKTYFSDEYNYIPYISGGHMNRSVIEFVNSFPNNYYNNPIELPSRSQIEIICKIVIDAFLEDSLLRKHRLLSLAYFMIVNEFGQINRNEIFDADTATLVSSLILLKINPPNFMTNILFLEDSIRNNVLNNFFSCAFFVIFNAFDTTNPNVIDKDLLFIQQDSPYKK